MRKVILSIVVFTCLVKNSVLGQYWSALGGGIGYPEWLLVPVDGPTDGYDGPATGHPVASMCEYNGELYAAGFFDFLPDSNYASNIAKWNGTRWQPIPGVYTEGGGGFDSWINALLVYNGELYVAGRFTNAGNIQTYNIAKWNGTHWSAVGNGLGTYGHSVSALVVYNGELYAGGHFYNSGSIPLNHVAKWNGSNWSPVGTGIDADIIINGYPYGDLHSLIVHNGELYAGGYFDTTGSVTNNIVKWDGTNWSSLSSGVNGSVYTLSVHNGSLIAGGHFDTAGVAAANYIARWDGNSWSSIGNGMNKSVSCMISYNGSLYAGGYFSNAGNVRANRIAKWAEQCDSVPAQPAGIIGSTSACQGRNAVYYINPVTNAADYTWTLPPGWSGSSISNRLVTLTGINGGTLSVTANNPCGSSLTRTIQVDLSDTVPAQLDTVSGNKQVCPKSTQIYSINPVPAATSYVWILPGGWTGNSTTNTVTTVSGTTGGIISVRARNYCSSSNPQTLVVDVSGAYPSQPDIITGQQFVNTGQTVTYSINQVTGATGYTWSLNGGGIISGGQTTTSVNINWQIPGNYILSVNANNVCGASLDQKITIKVTGTASEDPFELKILPNPTSGQFYLKAKAVQDKTISADVLNMSGQAIYRSGKRRGTNDYSQLIDLTKMSQGIYTLKIIVGDTVYVRRVAIIH